MPYIFQTLVFAYCVKTDIQRGTGTVGYCAGRDGNGCHFDCNWQERDRNGFMATGRDGTGCDFHSRVPL